MRTAVSSILAVVFVLVLPPHPARSVEFGIKSAASKVSTSAAGDHPDFTTKFVLNSVVQDGSLASGGRMEEVSLALPPGLIGDPTAIPRCPTGSLVAYGNCPIDSQVGIARIALYDQKDVGSAAVPLFNLEPPHPDVEVARFGFFAGFPVFIDVSVRTAGDYGITAAVRGAPAQAPVHAAETMFWGNPADPAHDVQRLTTAEALRECHSGTACKAPDGKRSSGLSPDTVFMTNPSACQEQSVDFAVKSYQWPGRLFGTTAQMDPTTDCTGLPFQPSFSARPTGPGAGAPTGLKTTLTLPAIDDADSRGTATMREARVTLPEGMTINPPAADGLKGCSEEQVGYRREVDGACPDASKLGTATIVSPSLAMPLRAAVYLRSPAPDRLFGLWLVSDDLGMHIKLPGEIEPDPRTGQLTAVFSDLPQVPVEEIFFHIWDGPRAPLKNPQACGTYSTSYVFLPHSDDPAVSGQTQMAITEGCDRAFAPRLRAGTTDPVAGQHSSLVFNLLSADGEEDIDLVEVTMPPGLLAKIRGVELCPEPLAAVGDCPAASQIGTAKVAVGAGPNPLWLPQPALRPIAVYLGGPYRSAPYSLVVNAPALAGPFDLGTVVARAEIDVDPATARAFVRSELPRIIAGVPISYRTLHVLIDRPGFVLNPTHCRELSFASTVTSTAGTLAHPADRFQVSGCKALGFKPRLALTLKGDTDRGKYPALTARLKTRNNDANIARASVTLPSSAFLAQEHLETICTRKQFAIDRCPRGSIYGRAVARTPLLDKPLSGPVYLRSSDRRLPALVVALRGQVGVDVAGHIDSHRRRIRVVFDSIPDAPVSSFVLHMKGGDNGLIVNSRDLCRRSGRAVVRLTAQNNRRRITRPLVETACRRPNAMR